MLAEPSGIPNIEDVIANRTEHDKAIDSIIDKIAQGEDDSLTRLLQDLGY